MDYLWPPAESRFIIIKYERDSSLHFHIHTILMAEILPKAAETLPGLSTYQQPKHNLSTAANMQLFVISLYQLDEASVDVHSVLP